MSSTKRMHLKGIVKSRGEVGPLLQSAGDAVLIVRERRRWLILSCPCGCGEQFPINLDPMAGPAWKLYGDEQRGWTLYPSVWRESGCRSHYVIWYNRIRLFSDEDWWDVSELQDETNDDALRAIEKTLRRDQLRPYWEIADEINAIPWDVLLVCRTLARTGIAVEGRGPERGQFGLR